MAEEDNKSLWELLEFSAFDERHKMAAYVIGLTLSWQIRAMRKNRGWTVSELGSRLSPDKPGSGNSLVYRLEDADGVLHVTTATLLRVAAVFDVALMVRWTAWKEWMEQMLGGSAFRVPAAYSEELIKAIAPVGLGE